MAQQQGGGWGRGETPYDKWEKGENIPLYSGSHVDDLYHCEVEPWARFGDNIKGAIANLAGQQQDDGWIIEMPPGGQTAPVHHMFEATYFIISGRGATTFWQPGKPKQTVEWKDGSLFSPPLNCYYQHFNLDGQNPARVFAGTTAPRSINLLRSGDWAFNDDYVFADRFSGEEDDFFSDPGRMVGVRRWKTNFVPDVRSFKLDSWEERGAGGTNMFFSVAGNSMSAHLSDFPTGTYKKAHRHGPGAYIIVLNGVGYSMLWFKDEKEPTKVDWTNGSLVSPMDQQYHQHFNPGTTNARYLAYTYPVGGGAAQAAEQAEANPGQRAGGGADVSEREGGMQVEYEDEMPIIWETFDSESKRHGSQNMQPKPNYRKD